MALAIVWKSKQMKTFDCFNLLFPAINFIKIYLTDI